MSSPTSIVTRQFSYTRLQNNTTNESQSAQKGALIKMSPQKVSNSPLSTETHRLNKEGKMRRLTFSFIRNAIRKIGQSKPQSTKPDTVRPAPVSEKEMINHSITQFNIVEGGKTDQVTARQILDSTLCSIYSAHKDNFLKRLDQSSRHIQQHLFSTLDKDTKQEIQQALSLTQNSMNTHTTNTLSETVQPAGEAKAAGKILSEMNLQKVVATAYQKGRNDGLTTETLKTFETKKLTPMQKNERQQIHNEDSILSTAKDIAYYKGVHDGLHNAFLNDLGKAAKDAGLAGNENDKKIFTPTGAGANVHITAVLSRLHSTHPQAMQNTETKAVLSKYAHELLMAEVSVLAGHYQEMALSKSDKALQLDPNLIKLVGKSPKDFADTLTKISTYYSER